MAHENELGLTEPELQEAEQKSSVTVQVVHQAVRREGEQELRRTPAALWWSGLAAGLSMGFSLITEGVLRSRLPDAPWRPLIAKFGYSIGFVLVILGRQQLFTENTLTPMLPLFHNRTSYMAARVARLWAIVLAANLVGAFAVAWALSGTNVFPADVRTAFLEIGREAILPGFGTVLLRGIFAGWLIAMLVWVLPFAETTRFFVIVTLTWVIAICGFSHVIAGSIEALFVALDGGASWAQAIGGYIVPALVGNIIGGVSLVAVLNHAQVIS